MNQILIQNLRLLLMLRGYLIILLIPVYLLALHFSPPIKGILYVFTTVIVFGPLVSTPEAADLKHKVSMTFCSLPLSRRQIVLGNFYAGYILLGLVIALVFLGSVLMHALSSRWQIMSFGEIVFILIIICLEDLLETFFADFYYDVSQRGLRMVFVISAFFLMSFLVYPYLIASVSRLDFSWPSEASPMQLTLQLLNRPLPALVTCLLLFPALSFTLKQKIRYFENKDV